MDVLLRRVRAARRRLVMGRFAQLAVYYLLAAGACAAGLVWAARWTTVPVLYGSAIAAGAALLVAMAHALATRPSMRTAALALDAATGLEERVTTALSLHEASSPAARAVIDDAIQAVRAADAARIAIDRPRRAAMLAAPAVLIVGGLVLPDLSRKSGAADADVAGSTAVVPAPIRKQESTRLRNRAFELEKRAEERNLPQLKELAQAMRDASEAIRQKDVKSSDALAKISRLEDKAKERRDELAKNPALAENLLRKNEDGAPADSAEAAAKASELDKKLSELEAKVREAQKRLDESGKGGAEAKRLREALKELADGLEGLGGEKMRDLEKKLEEMAKEGAADKEALQDLLESLDGELGEMAEALDEWGLLEGEMDALEALKGKLAGKLGKCPFCGKKGEGGG